MKTIQDQVVKFGLLGGEDFKMTAAGNIAGLIPTFSALALVGENVKFASKKKKSSKDFLKTGATNIVGLSLIQTQAQLAGKIL